MTHDLETRLRDELHAASAQVRATAGDWRDVRRRARRDSRRRATVAGGVLTVAAVVATGAFVSGRDAPRPAATQPPVPPSPVVARVDLGSTEVAALAAAGDVAWASRWDRGDVVGVAADGVRRTLTIGSARTGAISLAAAGETLWVASVTGNAVLRFRTTDGKHLGRIGQVETATNAALAATREGVWVACCNESGRGVLRLYPTASDSPVRDVTTRGDGPADVAVAAGHVWVSRTGAVEQFAPDGRLVRRHPVPGDAEGTTSAYVVGDGGVVWFLTDRLLTRIDPATGARLTSVPFPQVGDVGSRLPAAGGVAVAAFGSLWLSASGTLFELDRDTAAVLATVDVPESGRLAAGAAALWVVSGTELWQVDPARARRPPQPN